MEVTKTIKAKLVGLTNVKKEALESEYANYQKALLLSKQLVEELKITSLKQAGGLLYNEDSEYSLKHSAKLYSATYQMAFKKALHTRGKSRRENPLRLRNDTFDVKRFPSKIATYWAKIPIYCNRGGVKVALRMSPKHEELLADPHIKTCDSELLKQGDNFFIHITVKKCVDTTPKRPGKLAVISIDAGIRNTATSVVWRDSRIHGVKMHSGKKLKHRVKQMKARLGKCHRTAFNHNSYHCVEKALDRETVLGQKLNNYTKDYLHKLSSEIVAKALELRSQGYNVLIACENLKHIRKGISGKLHWWAFRQLLDFVKYKAEWEGIAYLEVEPANTSRICPKCGNYDKNNRKAIAFKCTECEYNANADLVGATNVARRSLGSCELHAYGNGQHESAQEVALTTPQAMMSKQTRRYSDF